MKNELQPMQPDKLPIETFMKEHLAIVISILVLALAAGILYYVSS